jgi:hypothetical protein
MKTDLRPRTAGLPLTNDWMGNEYYMGKVPQRAVCERERSGPRGHGNGALNKQSSKSPAREIVQSNNHHAG